MKEIYIYGASGHGLVVADIARSNGYENIIFVDDGENDHLFFEDIKNKNHIPIALGIGSNKIRKILFNKLLDFNFEIVSLIHPSAVISISSEIQKGTVIMPNVVINAQSKIGKGVILNTSCVIEHENMIEDFVHISPGVKCAGNVTVKKNTHLGIGSSVIQGIVINENCIIGANSTVVKSISKNKKAYGSPCKEVGNINE